MFLSPLTLSSTYVASTLLPRTSMSIMSCCTVTGIIRLVTKFTNFISDPLSFFSILNEFALPITSLSFLVVFSCRAVLDAECWWCFFGKKLICLTYAQILQPALPVLGNWDSIWANLGDQWLSQKWHLHLCGSCLHVPVRDQVQWMWMQQGWYCWAGRWILIGWAAVPPPPPSPRLLGMRQGERSSRRCTNVNGGCRGITSMHRGITRIHRGITIIHSGAARRRRRRIVNPIHVALEKGLGDSHCYLWNETEGDLKSEAFAYLQYHHFEKYFQRIQIY